MANAPVKGRSQAYETLGESADTEIVDPDYREILSRISEFILTSTNSLHSHRQVS